LNSEKNNLLFGEIKIIKLKKIILNSRGLKKNKNKKSFSHNYKILIKPLNF